MLETACKPENASKELKAAVRHTAVYGLGNIVAKALGFLMIPFYTHYLAPAAYGLLEILDLSMSLFAMVLHMGIAPALLRSYAAAPTDGERKRAVSTAFVFVFVTGLGTFLVGLWLVPQASVALLGAGVSSKYLLLSFCSFIFSYLATMPRAYLRAREASGVITVIETGSLFAMLALNIYFIAVLNLGAVGVLWSAVIVNGIQAVLFPIWLIREVGVEFSFAHLREMTAFGLPLILSNISLFALNFSDRFFLQHLRSLDAVGIYSLGYKFAFMINFLLVQPFYTMWQARMYVVYRQPDHARIFSQMFILYSLVLTYAALGLAVFSPEIVSTMAGPKFAASQEIVPIVALAYVFYGLGYYLQLGMFLTSKTRAIGFVSIGAALLNLGLNYCLIGKFGMLGAAWATLLGFIAIAAGSYWFSEKALPLRLGVDRVMAAIAVAIVLYVLCARGVPGSMPVTLAIKACGLMMFPLLLWGLRLLSPSELGVLASARNKMAAGIGRGMGWVLGR